MGGGHAHPLLQGPARLRLLWPLLHPLHGWVQRKMNGERFSCGFTQRMQFGVSEEDMMRMHLTPHARPQPPLLPLRPAGAARLRRRQGQLLRCLGRALHPALHCPKALLPASVCRADPIRHQHCKLCHEDVPLQCLTPSYLPPRCPHRSPSLWRSTMRRRCCPARWPTCRQAAPVGCGGQQGSCAVRAHSRMACSLPCWGCPTPASCLRRAIAQSLHACPSTTGLPALTTPTHHWC